jgi:hypothetical protein
MTASISGLLAFAIVVLCSFEASAEDHARRTEKMPFAECLTLIDEVAEELGVDSIDLQRTGDVHSARIAAADGDVMLVCRRADQTVTLLRTAG